MASERSRTARFVLENSTVWIWEVRSHSTDPILSASGRAELYSFFGSDDEVSRASADSPVTSNFDSLITNFEIRVDRDSAPSALR